MDKTRQDKFKMFLWARQDKHGTPDHDMWTGSTGLESAAGSVSRGRRRHLPQKKDLRRSLPNSHADLTRARAEGRVATSMPRDRQTGTKQKILKKNGKTKRGEGAPLTVRSGILSWCTQQGGTRTRRRGRKLKLTVFNVDTRQGKTRIGRLTETPGSNK